MTKSMLKKIMYRNYNLPKVTAFIHATLLVLFMTSLITYAYVILTPDLLTSADADSFGIISFHRYFWSNKLPLLMAFGLLAGLNELVYYLLFRLRKKPAAYSFSAVVLALQVALIGGGMTLL
jgi:hypothetical protein